VRRLATAVLGLLVGCAHTQPPVPGGAEEGDASYYGPGFYGRRTASGEVLRPGTLTAAHRTLPFGTCVRVTMVASGRDVEVRINDRGPFVAGRIIDVSETAAQALGMLGHGVARVRIAPCPRADVPADEVETLALVHPLAHGCADDPMRIALDTSTLTLSLALVGPGPALVELQTHPPPRKQSEMLPGAILDLLARHGLGLADVTGYAVGLGPGSFTGLRIGLATVKALAYAHRRPVGGASSLAALALEGPDDVPLVAATVARKGELYVGRYRRQGGALASEGPEEAWAPAELGSYLSAHPEAQALGPAAVGVAEALIAAGADPAQLLPGPTVPSAWAVARLARIPEAFTPEALFALEPHYLRASEAERNPRFPPLAGPAPTARIRGDQE
jgi:tRNA threonylcarbamoyladenosine biosynthesis protein TsaB